MTTPTAQTTVFSPAVKADVEILVAPARCPEGQEIHKAWVNAYNKAVREPGDGYQIVFYKGFMPYARHMMTCADCAGYEAWRRHG